MDARDWKIVEMVFVFGGVLGVAIWQWLSVRRALREDDARRAREGSDAES